MEKIRVRYAPSPTGQLHMGSARTAWYNYLFSKNNNGKFIVRIEDTDLERNTDTAINDQLQDLQWLNMHWDEGLTINSNKQLGEYGPYKQSQRLSIYKKYAEQLLENNNAYYCFLTDDEIDQQRNDCKDKGITFHIKSPYRI